MVQATMHEEYLSDRILVRSAWHGRDAYNRRIGWQRSISQSKRRSRFTCAGIMFALRYAGRMQMR